MTNPDFVKLAESMNVKGMRCERLEDLPAKMKEFLEYDGSRPVLLECWVDKGEHVFPMIPAGHALHQPVVSIGEDDRKGEETVN
jgi:acetolactate synthase-1/2/3 large subunit